MNSGEATPPFHILLCLKLILVFVVSGVILPSLLLSVIYLKIRCDCDTVTEPLDQNILWVQKLQPCTESMQ